MAYSPLFSTLCLLLIGSELTWPKDMKLGDTNRNNTEMNSKEYDPNQSDGSAVIKAPKDKISERLCTNIGLCTQVVVQGG